MEMINQQKLAGRFLGRQPRKKTQPVNWIMGSPAGSYGIFGLHEPAVWESLWGYSELLGLLKYTQMSFRSICQVSYQWKGGTVDFHGFSGFLRLRILDSRRIRVTLMFETLGFITWRLLKKTDSRSFLPKTKHLHRPFFFLAGLAAILVILVNLIMKWHEFPWTSLWFAITLFGTGHGSRWLPHPGCWQLHKQIQESYGQIQAEHPSHSRGTSGA